MASLSERCVTHPDKTAASCRKTWSVHAALGKPRAGSYSRNWSSHKPPAPKVTNIVKAFLKSGCSSGSPKLCWPTGKNIEQTGQGKHHTLFSLQASAFIAWQKATSEGFSGSKTPVSLSALDQL